MNEELQSLTRYDHIAFTSGNGIQAVMQRLEGLNGSRQAALQALQDSKVQRWALGADAEVLKQFGVQTVQTPTEVHLLQSCIPRITPTGGRCCSI